MRRLVLVGVAAIVLVAGALVLFVLPRKRCTQVGCMDGPTVVFSSASGGWAAGTYAFSITSAEKKYVCIVRWPEHLAALVGPGPGPKCSAPAHLWLWSEEIARRRNRGEEASPGDYRQVEWSARVEGFGLPPWIEVSVEHDGRQLLRTRHSLTYQDRYANGPDCGVTCRAAFVLVKVPVVDE